MAAWARLWTRALQWPPGWSAELWAVLPQVRELVDKVQAAFVETLDELSWMDKATKQKAREKVGRTPEGGGQGCWQTGGAAAGRARRRPPGASLYSKHSEGGGGRLRRALCAETGLGAKPGRPSSAPKAGEETKTSGSRVPRREACTPQEPLCASVTAAK